MWSKINLKPNKKNYPFLLRSLRFFLLNRFFFHFFRMVSHSIDYWILLRISSSQALNFPFGVAPVR
jgi:hypothetical protein